MLFFVGVILANKSMKINLVITSLFVICVSLGNFYIGWASNKETRKSLFYFKASGKPAPDSNTVENSLKIIINAYRIIRDLKARSNETDERQEETKRQLINKLQFIQDEKISSVRKKLEPLKVASQLKLDRIYKVESVLAMIEERTKSAFDQVKSQARHTETSSSLRTLSATLPKKESTRSDNEATSSRDQLTYKFVPYDESDKMPYQLNIDLSDHLDPTKHETSRHNDGESVANNHALTSAYLHLEGIDTLEGDTSFKKSTNSGPMVNTEPVSLSEVVENSHLHETIQQITEQEPTVTNLPLETTSAPSNTTTVDHVNHIANSTYSTSTQEVPKVIKTIHRNHSTEQPPAAQPTTSLEADLIDERLSSLLNKDLIDELERIKKKDLDLLLIH